MSSRTSAEASRKLTESCSCERGAGGRSAPTISVERAGGKATDQGGGGESHALERRRDARGVVGLWAAGVMHGPEEVERLAIEAADGRKGSVDSSSEERMTSKRTSPTAAWCVALACGRDATTSLMSCCCASKGHRTTSSPRTLSSAPIQRLLSRLKSSTVRASASSSSRAASTRRLRGGAGRSVRCVARGSRRTLDGTPTRDALAIEGRRDQGVNEVQPMLRACAVGKVLGGDGRGRGQLSPSRGSHESEGCTLSAQRAFSRTRALQGCWNGDGALSAANSAIRPSTGDWTRLCEGSTVGPSAFRRPDAKKSACAPGGPTHLL